MPLLGDMPDSEGGAAGYEGELFVYAAGRSISDENYQAFLDACVRFNAEHGIPRANVVLGHVQIPTRAQRAKLQAYIRAGKLVPPKRIVILTESAIFLGFAKACAIVMPFISFRAFKPTALPAALDWLAEVAAFDRQPSEHMIRDVGKAIGWNEDVFTLPFAQRASRR